MPAASPAPPFSIRGTLDALRWPTGTDLLFAIKAAIAVSLALLIGFSQNLENPYWSALTIYVLVAQPQTGAIRSKALFRLAGTVMGGSGAILLAAMLGSHIGVLLIATIVAVVIAFYAKTLDRTPAAYTWFATALTLAVIGIVHVQSPQTMFAFATTRMAESCVGILMIGLVDSIILPRAATPDFVTSIAAWRTQASDWAAAALAPGASQAPDARWERRKGLRALAGLLGPLDAIGVQLPYDTVAVPPRGHDLRFVRLTIAHLIAHLAAANLWIAIARGGPAGAFDVEPLAAEVRAWLLDRPALDDPAILDHATRGEDLRARLAAFEPVAAAAGDRAEMLRATMLFRLAELVHHWSRLERTLHAIATGRRMPPALRAEAKRARPVRSIDYLLGVVDVAPLALALGFGATLWYLTAWTSGISAMLFAFVSLSFIIGTPGAVRAAGGTALWVSLAFVMTFLYQFAILPRVTDFPLLIAVLVVGTLPLGILMAMAPAGLLILANGFAFLGLQNAYAADFGTTLQNLLGSLAGCLIAIAALHLCQFDRERFRARRLARALRRDVADVARARRLPDADRLLSISVDRLALYFGIVDRLPADDPLQANDLIEPLRVAANLVRLRAQERGLSAEACAAIDALSAVIAAGHRGTGEPDRGAMLRHVEIAYDALLGEPQDRYRTEALAALTGLRVALSSDPLLDTRVRRNADG